MKNKKLIILLLLFIALIIINYFTLIPLNLRYTKTFILFIILAIAIYMICSTKATNRIHINIGKEYIETIRPSKNLYYIVVIAIGLVIIHGLSSTKLLFSKQYQQLIGDVEEETFTSDFTKIEGNDLPIVDKEYAKQLGDKKIGSERGLGSEFHVGEFTDITVKGEMKLVAPLEYNGLFKWLNNKGTPGYILVDKVTGNVELITEINGKKLNLKYLPSAYLQTDLKRHVYLSGHFDNNIMRMNFEIDDEGNPYWIIIKTQKTIGINGGDDVKSVVIVDAQTGKMKEYQPKDVPEWVDVVYPAELVMNQLNDWGIYVKGFWNTMFGQKEIIKTTTGNRKVYNDNIMYHYTGMTSAASDESTVGFAFINTRTKQASFYKVTGATEEAAMASAEGKVQNLRYNATFPLPLNINDQPTFFITLKDSKGLIKQYAFVNIENFSIVGNGETIEDARNAYIRMLQNDNSLPDNENKKTLTGKVVRFGSDITDGNTLYYIKLEGIDGIYYGDAHLGNSLPITKENDQLTIEVSGNKILKFTNHSI